MLGENIHKSEEKHMISKTTFDFLTELKKNNNRDWFNANKSWYEEARAEFEGFIGDLIVEIARFDPPIAMVQPKKSIFRIYRDTRFSKDKSPYKTNFGAHLVPNAEKPHDRAGYYIHLEPSSSILAGGAYRPPSPWLRAIRETIAEKGDKLIGILANPNFKKYFGELEGEKLKSNPRDYPADHPHIELLRRKSLIAVHNVSDTDIQAKDFVKHAAKVFEALKPFDDFLNRRLP